MNKTKFAVSNYQGITVSCSDDTWEGHIVPGHSIMRDNVDAVKDTIKRPDTVYSSNQPGKREVYFKASDISTYDALTKVVVEYSPGKKNPDAVVGNVVTAFPTKAEKGGIANVIFPKPKN